MTTQRDTAPLSIVKHALSGVTFPQGVVMFGRGDGSQYDTFGHNLGVGYRGMGEFAHAQATAYVYPALGRRDDEEMSRALSDIHQVSSGFNVVQHGSELVRTTEALWALAHLDSYGGQTGESLAWVWLLEADRWFVKLRCTHDADPEVDVEVIGRALREFMLTLGVPDTAKRLESGYKQALARSRDALEQLARWSPSPPREAHSTLSPINELAAQQKYAEAAEALAVALNGGLAPETLQAEVGRLYLLSGDLLAATEACMAEQELRTSAHRALEHALRVFVAEDLSFEGGWGTSPEDAVIIGNAPTRSIWTNAVHRYLECVLGLRGAEWRADRAAILYSSGRLYELMTVSFAEDKETTVVFSRDEDVSEFGLSDDCVLGSVTLDADLETAGSQVNMSPEIQDEALATFVLEGLMQHTSQSLLNGTWSDGPPPLWPRGRRRSTPKPE